MSDLELANGEDIQPIMEEVGRRARSAAGELSRAADEAKIKALRGAARAIRANSEKILKANEKDMATAETSRVPDAFLDRLHLDAGRIETIASGLEDVAVLPDPVGEVIGDWVRPNGLHISRVRVPLGVIGIIYESRPNVTADAGALCLKSGNAAILRGGSESKNSNAAYHLWCQNNKVKYIYICYDFVSDCHIAIFFRLFWVNLFNICCST